MMSLICSPSFGQQPTSKPAGSAADTAAKFLDQLNKGQVRQALELWDRRAVNDGLKHRIEKMPAKLAKLGGIKSVDVGAVEARQIGPECAWPVLTEVCEEIVASPSRLS